MPPLDALLDGLDESLQPINAEDVKPKEDVEAAEDEAEEATDEVTDEEVADDEEEEKVVDEDGLTIDELEAQEEEEKKEDAAVAVPKPDTSGFTPEQRFIYDGLPVVGIADKEGKVYNVKTFAELPSDFEFGSKRDEMAFLNAMNAQEHNARELQSNFKSKEAEKSAADWKAKENLADRYDIDELQGSGELAKFDKNITPGSKEFATQPTAKLIKDVMAYKEELNQANYERSQKNGTAMRLVGFKEAFIQYKYYDKGEKAANPKQKAEDAERKSLAKRTTGTKSTSAAEEKPRPFLSSQRDLMNYIDNLDI